jgi:virulence factor Mce-like protein
MKSLSASAVKLGLCVATIVIALILVIAGHSQNPANFLPRLTSSSDYSKTLYVDFVSAVNLPLGARVLSRGTPIGAVESIGLQPDAARLKLAVDPRVELREGTTAELRQLTMLGDIYVALTPPAAGSGGPPMGDGAVIGLADSDPGPQVEDILTNLADFMSGGSIMRAQDAVRKMNSSIDVGNGSLRSASRSTAMAVTDLATETNSLDAIIDSLYGVTGEIASDPAALGYSFGPAGINGLKEVFNAVNEGFKLVAGSSRLAHGLAWLTPRLAELNPFLDRLVPLLRSYSVHSTQFNGNAGALIDVTKNKLIPFAENPSVSITRVSAGDGDVTRSVSAVLHMIGALR